MSTPSHDSQHLRTRNSSSIISSSSTTTPQSQSQPQQQKKFYNKDARFFTTEANSLADVTKFSEMGKWRGGAKRKKQIVQKSCFQRLCCWCCCWNKRLFALFVFLLCFISLGYVIFLAAFYLSADVVGLPEGMTASATSDWAHWRDQIKNVPVYVDEVKRWWSSEEGSEQKGKTEQGKSDQQGTKPTTGSASRKTKTKQKSKTPKATKKPAIPTSPKPEKASPQQSIPPPSKPHDEELHHFINDKHTELHDHHDETHKLFFEEISEWEEIEHGHHVNAKDTEPEEKPETKSPVAPATVETKPTVNPEVKQSTSTSQNVQPTQGTTPSPQQPQQHTHNIEANWNAVKESASQKIPAEQSTPPLQDDSIIQEAPSTPPILSHNTTTQPTIIEPPTTEQEDTPQPTTHWKQNQRTTIYSLHFEQDILQLLTVQNSSVPPLLIRIGTEGFLPTDLKPSELQFDIEGASHWISSALEHSLIASDVVWLHTPHQSVSKAHQSSNKALFSELHVPVLGDSSKCGKCYHCPTPKESAGKEILDWCQELRNIPSTFCECESRNEMSNQKMFMCDSVTSVPQIASSRVARLIRREHPYIVSIDESYFHGIPHDFSYFFPKGSILGTDFEKLQALLEDKGRFCGAQDVKRVRLTEWLHNLLKTPQEEWLQLLPQGSNATADTAADEDLASLWCNPSQARDDLVSVQHILLRIAYCMNYISWKWLLDQGFPTVGCTHDDSSIYGLCSHKEEQLEKELKDLLKRFSIPPQFITVLKSDTLNTASNRHEKMEIKNGVAERLYEHLKEHADFEDWTSFSGHAGANLLHEASTDDHAELSISFQTKQKMIQLLEQFLQENQISSLLRFMKSHYPHYLRWLKENAAVQHESLDAQQAMDEEGKAQDLYARFIEIERLFTSSRRDEVKQQGKQLGR